ncbi:MAG: aminotransferase class III-fold pyridoxal phosphate-dependent enzyme [Limisphaerales bacterium]
MAEVTKAAGSESLGPGRVLVTTAIEQTWPKQGHVVFLGGWCLRYSRQDAWSKLDHSIAPYHWDDRTRIPEDLAYVSDVYERLLSGLASRLNEIHGVDHSLRYWRLVVGWWLFYSVEPDLVCCGKGASSSVPLAFVLGSSYLLDLPSVGSMSSTHSANPISCAAGLANLKVIESEGLIERSRTLGLRFHAELHSMAEESSAISSIQGQGMVAAILTNAVGEADAATIASEISWECMRRGLLVVHTGRESVKLAPPLNIEVAAMLEGLSVLRQVIHDVEEEHK